MFNVCMCARFQANPKESHEKVVKRIIRYIPCVGLWYPKGVHFELLGYADSNFAGCKIDRKNTTGDANYLGDIWCLGTLRSKIRLSFPPRKPNRLPPALVALKSFI